MQNIDLHPQFKASPGQCEASGHALPDGSSADCDEALAAVASHAGTVIIDFDETLYLRNSTEDFLDCIAPGVAGKIFLKALGLLGPWRFTGSLTRDAWRVRIAAFLFPWIWLRWRARVEELAANEVNVRLRAAIAQRGNVVVATLGFEPVVRPLLDAMGLSHVELVSCRFGSLEDRRVGKLTLLRERIGEEAVARSLVITDSQDDDPLLDACAAPFFVIWPEARFVPALSRVYLPFEYLTKVKRPKKRYFLGAILGDDFVMWVLASLALAASIVPHVVGLLLLLVSFWAIYERGYVDNDQIAASHEKDPVLSDAFHENHVATPMAAPWIWAIIFGFAGVSVLAWPEPPATGDLAAWSAVLLGTHFFFRAYNRIDKAARIWMFAGLQLARVFAFVAIVPVTAIGAVALSALALSRWVPYFVYRATNTRKWPGMPVQVVRLMFFLVMGFTLLIGAGAGMVEWWTGAALLSWCILRAAKNVYTIARSTRTVYVDAGAQVDRHDHQRRAGAPRSVTGSSSDAQTPLVPSSARTSPAE
ncbi:MAG TPA: haloacid dehalogenase-like hydrolase [Saliniramus sp.]|nr:haloacid dehalogenase-like hydrolase [Saliniramus sp.]